MTLLGDLSASSSRRPDVYVVHGIPGDDLGLDPALPVDIAVNGACALDDIVFTDVLPTTLETGHYRIEISVSDGVVGTCDGLPAVAGSIDISVAETATIVAHLDQNGAPTISKFTNKLGKLDDLSRVVVIHAAAAPAVDVKAKGSKCARLKLRDLAPGDQSFAADVPPDTYKVVVRGANGEGTVFGPAELPPLGPGVAATAIAVGSLEHDTFTVILQVIAPATE